MAITIQDGFSVRTTVPVDARFVADTITSMNAMEAEVRYEGLTCYVVENGVLYHLKGGILNEHWLPVGSGDIVGPAGPVLNNSIAVFSGTSGKELKSTPVNIDAYGGITGVSEISAASALLGSLRIAEIVNSGSTGENVTLPITYGRVVLTNSSLVSIAEISTSFMVNPMSVEVTLHNRTGNKIILVHDYISASEAILLPNEKDLTIPNEGSVTLVKSSQAGGKFIIKGGAGGGQGSLNSSQLTLLTADDSLTDWDYTSSFTISKANPIHGEASYSLGMTTGENAKHKLIPVYPFFRKSNLAFLISYRGVSLNPISGSAKAVIYDQADEKIAEWILPAITSEIQKFGKTFFMPPSTTGVRLQIESTSTVVDEFIQFDNIEITSDILKSVNISNDTDWAPFTPVANGVGTISNASGTWRREGPNLVMRGRFAVGTPSATVFSINIPNGHKAIFPYSFHVGTGTREAGAATYSKDHVANVYTETSIAFSIREMNSSTSPFGIASATSIFGGSGQQFMFDVSIPIQGWASSIPHIVAPVDQVTERIINFQFKSTALTDSDPIGAYNYYNYTANSNSRTLATTVQTSQTPADMSVNGIKIFTRTYNAASGASNPARFEIKIAEPNQMEACDTFIFKDASRLVSASEGFFADGTAQYGLFLCKFNPYTGILSIDGGRAISGGVTSNAILFNDLTSQTNGYVCFTASKLAQGVAIPVPARYVVKTYQSGSYYYNIYNDGWVEQGNNGSVGATTLVIPARDTTYVLSGNRNDNPITGFDSDSGILFTSKSTTSFTSKIGSSFGGSAVCWTFRGYGSSSVVKSLGADPIY